MYFSHSLFSLPAPMRWPSSLQVLRTAEPPLHQTKPIPPHPPCTPLKNPLPCPQRQGQPPVPKDRAMSVEPRHRPDHLDFNFLRMASTMEQVDGELQSRCAGCLWLYPSLVALQNHIALSWMEGFSCRVYYRKLWEIRHRNDTRKLHDRTLTVVMAKRQPRPPMCVLPVSPARGGRWGGLTGQQQGPAGGPGGREDQGTPNQTLSLHLVETVRRNTVIHKWLSEIEAPDGVTLSQGSA